MDKNEKAALDAYRQERKERIAKQAKQTSKKSNSHYEGKAVLNKVVKIVVSVALCVAIVAASLNFFGVPQQLLKSVVIDGQSYSMAELTFYYMQMYNQTYQTANSYNQQYGDGTGKMLTGYDVTLPPDEQTKKNEDGETITWEEYFLDQAIESMATVKRYYTVALDKKIELTDDAKAEIDSYIKTLDQVRGDYSVSRYLTETYGKGVTERLFRQMLEEQQIVSLYQQQRQDELKGNYSDDKINAEYSKDKTKYDVVSFRWYTIDITSKGEEVSSELKEEASSGAASASKKVYKEEAQAKAFIEKVKATKNYNEETFKSVVLETVGKDSKDYETYKADQSTKIEKLDKETLETNVSKDASNWLFETDDKGNYVRQPGDMNYFVSSDAKDVYILYATGIPYQDDDVLKTVRHILVKFPETATGKTETASGEDTSDAEEATLSDKAKAEYESEAVSIYDLYNKYIKENTSGKADEDYFVELVSKYSDDTGSKSTGGLIEDMRNDGQYVAEFEDWAFAEGEFEGEERKPGSTGIIESEFGYHIMYYSSEHEKPIWYETILDDFVAEDWEKEQTEFEKQFGEDAIERKELIVKSVRKACLKTIKRIHGY